MARGVSGPFIITAPGGQFFTLLPPEPHLLNAYKLLLDARETALRNYPGGEGRARALAIDVVLKEVQTRVDAAAAATAVEADKLIVTRIKSTQVRPDPPGNSGRHVRLENAIHSRPIKTSVPGGGVGIADITELDKVADKYGQQYWRAQEFGSAHNVGKEIRGYFYPGGVAADAGQQRVHPIFETKEGGPSMLIQRPIPERAFLREGSAAAEIFRQKQLGQAVAPSIGELKLIQSGNHPRIRAAERYLKGKKPPVR